MEKTTYYPGIKRYIASRVSNHSDAEDLTQSVFLEFYSSNHNGDNPEPYLFGIARNQIADYYSQKYKKSASLKLDKQITGKISYSRFNKDSKVGELIEEIQNAIAKLPPKARKAVQLRLIDDLSYEEAADNAGCSVERFYDRLYEGVKILKKYFHSKPFIEKDLNKKVQKN